MRACKRIVHTEREAEAAQEPEDVSPEDYSGADANALKVSFAEAGTVLALCKEFSLSRRNARRLMQAAALVWLRPERFEGGYWRSNARFLL